uniref:Histone RNA hairpin-binding protein RNA-binding domain-containing protein n=1 Tax=Neobodo designis TaxID=312471 RepID=A0A7S1L5C9_NEODS
MPSNANRTRGCADEERRKTQREKQISFGYNTTGYHNMNRLIKSDPRLANGGILPLQPPPADLDTTKRTWDVLIRKWRRALHMFDHVFIDEEDGTSTTIESVMDAQRREWLRDPETCTQQRRRIPADELLGARKSERVPTKIPVDDELRGLLRSESCFAGSVTDAVHEHSPQHAATLSRVRHAASISATNFGVKLLVTPGGTAATCPTCQVHPPATAQ